MSNEKYFLDSGSGLPILCVHGFPFDHTMWDVLAERISEDFRIIAPDLRGMGKNPQPVADVVMMAEFADDLANFLDMQGIKKCVFCGLSMGGYIGWEFWKRHADRLYGIILCDSNAGCDTPQAAENRERTAQRVLKEGTAFLAEAMIGNILAQKTVLEKPEVVAHYRRMVEENAPRGVAAAARGLGMRRDFREMVKCMNLPVLVLSGSMDVLSPPERMRELVAEMPGAVYVEIPDAGHLAPLENPEDTAREVEAFCRQFL
ncbi:MAG: alpha/beta fold hydrolase [Planctomycetia bacterium]|nr:alpha/beta fold hydrolase [Planctomycetia bacterium]